MIHPEERPTNAPIATHLADFEWIAHLPFLAAVVDQQYTIVAVSRGWQKALSNLGPEIQASVTPTLRESIAMAFHGNSAQVGEQGFTQTGGGKQVFGFEVQPQKASSGEPVVVVYLEDLTSRRHAEEAAKLATTRFELALRDSDIVVFCQDLDLRYTWICNPAFDFDPNDVIGKTDTELFQRTSDASITEAIKRKVIETGIGIREEVNVLGDGNEHWFELIVEPSYDLSGEIDGVTCVTVDITNRKLAETALKQNAGLFTALIEQVPTGVYVVDSKFKLQQVNAEAMPVFASVNPLIGRDFDEVMEILWGPEVGPQCAAIFRHTLETGERYISPSFSEQRHDILVEQTFEWETQRIPLPDGTFGVVCYFHEVTDRARADRALRDSDQRMRLATEATGVGIWEWHVGTGRIRWDAQMCKMYGTEPTSDGFVDYTTWSSAVLPEDLATQERILRETLAQGSRSNREFRIRRADDGKVRHIQSVEIGRRDADGVVQSIIGTNLDITDRVEAEDRLQRLAGELFEADRRKDEFIAMLAHELRNPLAPIRLGIEFLKQISADSNQQSTLDMLARQVGQMVRLVDDLLDVSRISRGKIQLKKERIDLASIVKQAVEANQLNVDAARHTLTVECPDFAIPIDADPVRLSQVIGNLFNNSCKFTPAGGRIDLSLSVEGTDSVIRLRDNGIGMSQEQITKIFDMFAQVDNSLGRSQSGLGIGLTLVKALVELHGGTVEAYSDGLGRGSEFTVRIPLLATILANVPSARSEHLKVDGRKILVVDDNEDSARVLTLLLRQRGHQALTAHSGLDAVQEAQSFVPDTILLDIGLPILDGYEVCRRVRQLPDGDKIVIFALTGWGDDEARRRSTEAGFDGHLVKPIEIATLERILVDFPARRPEAVTDRAGVSW